MMTGYLPADGAHDPGHGKCCKTHLVANTSGHHTEHLACAWLSAQSWEKEGELDVVPTLNIRHDQCDFSRENT